MALMESSCAFVCNVKQYNKFKILADCIYVTHDVDAHESFSVGFKAEAMFIPSSTACRRDHILVGLKLDFHIYSIRRTLVLLVS